MDAPATNQYATEYEKISTKEEYIKNFKDEKLEEAFKYVLDIRKFEIELYWKRATYFWTFIGAILAAYFVLLTKIVELKSSTASLKTEYLLGCLGLVFSFAWHFVNRGSKFWQLNWEKHTDLMEDEVIGSLYKMSINKEYYRKKQWWNPLAPFPFSVTKINQILTVFFILFWTIMCFGFFQNHLNFIPFKISGYSNFYFAIGAITVCGILSMINFGQTGLNSAIFNKKGVRKNTFVNFEKAGIENKN